MKQKLTTGICIFIILTIAYLGYKFVPPYFRYYAFREDVIAISKLRSRYRSAKEFQNRIFEIAGARKIPITPQDISVQLTDDSVYIYVSWTETVEFPMNKKVNLSFEVETE